MIAYSTTDAPWSGSGHDARIAKQGLLPHGAAPGLVQLSRFIFEPGQTVEPHVHTDMWEAFHVLDGRLYFTVNGVERPVSAGEGLLIEPGEVHALRNVDDTPAILLLAGLERT